MSIIQSILNFLVESNDQCYPSLLANIESLSIPNLLNDMQCLNLVSTISTTTNSLMFKKIKIQNQLISKILGFSIAILASLIKFPQIIKFILNRSTEGLSVGSFSIENILTIISLGYSIQIDSPISLYREKYVLLIQNVIILALMYYYRQNSKNYYTQLNLLSAYMIISYFLVTNRIVPYEILAFLFTISPIFSLYSRFLQVTMIYRNKSTGHLSFITYFVNWFGVLARMFTIIIEQFDIPNIMQYLLAFLSQGIVVGQFIYYWNNTNRLHKEMEQKEDKKEN